jgi:transcriptional regulator with XRE-family HTH domain
MAPILGVQCFLARTALGWDATHLARAAEVSPPTVRRFERGDSVMPRTVEAIQGALEKAGVIFIDANDGGPGAARRGVGTKNPAGAGHGSVTANELAAAQLVSSIRQR